VCEALTLLEYSELTAADKVYLVPTFSPENAANLRRRSVTPSHRHDSRLVRLRRHHSVRQRRPTRLARPAAAATDRIRLEARFWLVLVVGEVPLDEGRAELEVRGEPFEGGLREVEVVAGNVARDAFDCGSQCVSDGSASGERAVRTCRANVRVLLELCQCEKCQNWTAERGAGMLA
jgi:hypothetical protein